MPNHLVIVESPGKTKSIERYLKGFSLPKNVSGSDTGEPDKFKVMSSVGHIRDLPTKGGIGLEPENNWKANYVIDPKKMKTVEKLRQEAKKAALIFLATDLDREGEAIAWHLKEVIGGDEDRFIRVVFNEITESAIHKAFAERGQINQDRVDAQQARRFLDRFVGFKLTPLLYRKIANGLSAGRVQSVAVRMVVERERTIRAFQPREFWNIAANLKRAGDAEPQRFEAVFRGELKFEIGNEEAANRVLAEIQRASPTVKSITRSNSESKPSAPFITSTLQRGAPFSAANTMRLAQRLYEAGLITYMRTDSTNLSDEARTAAANLIGKKFGSAYLPSTPNVFKSKSQAQEAHEAIRPSDVTLEPQSDAIATALQKLSAKDQQDAKRLYELIWRKLVASQMTPGRYENTTVTAIAGPHELRIRGRRTLFDGHTKVAPKGQSKESEQELPQYREGEALEVVELFKKQRFTTPPRRFTEGSLIGELEEREIGRPSTYTSILGKIEERGYVRVENRRFYATPVAEVVTDALIGSFAGLLNYEFTAQMEQSLDAVSEGTHDWIELLNYYYDDFSSKLDKAFDNETGMERNKPVPTDIACEACSRPMQLRIAKTGLFLGCSGFADRNNQCKKTVNLVSDEDVTDASTDDESDSAEAESRSLLSKRHCKKCGTVMNGYLISENLKLHICGNVPHCDGMEKEEGNFKIKGYDGPVVPCNKCSSDMELTTGRFGKYFDCTNDSCDNTRKLLREGVVAAPPIHMQELRVPDEDDYFVLREGKAGIFLGASKYPKIRAIRKPSIKELISHANELDPKFSHLLDAPAEDNQGNDSLVRYSRKSDEHYLTSDFGEKDTGWRAYFNDGSWDVVLPKPKKTKVRA